jgi:YggT family protein
MRLPTSNQVATIIHRLTEPLVAPIRKALPTIAGLDLSPLVLLTGLQILGGLVS